MGSITVPAIVNNKTSRYAGWHIYLSSNDHIPIGLYKYLPIVYLSLGAVGNILLLYYLIALKKYRSPVFMMIASLAVTDLLSCLSHIGIATMVLPTIVVPESNVNGVCKLTIYLAIWSVSCSAHHLVIFAAIRFYQLCFPLQARARVTSTYVLKWCLVIWFATGFAWAPFLYYQNADLELYNGHPAFVCIFLGDKLIRGLGFLIVNTIYPGVAIVLLHIAKYIRVIQARKNIVVQQERKNGDVRVLAIIILLFFITWIPCNTYIATNKFKPEAGLYQDKLYLILLYVIASNSTLNPIVYCVAAKTVRADIAKYICGIEKTKK